MFKRIQPPIISLSMWNAAEQQILPQCLSDGNWELFKRKQYWNWRAIIEHIIHCPIVSKNASYICVQLIFFSTNTYFYIKYYLSIFSIGYSDKLCKESRKIGSRTGKYMMQLNAVWQISWKICSKWNLKSDFWMTASISDWDQAQPIFSHLLYY